jgi:hypothetical protein
VNEAPDFVALHPLALHVANCAIVELDARYPRVTEEFGDRVEADIGNAGDRPHGRSLTKHTEDLGAFADGQLVYAPSIETPIRRYQAFVSVYRDEFVDIFLQESLNRIIRRPYVVNDVRATIFIKPNLESRIVPAIHESISRPSKARSTL